MTIYPSDGRPRPTASKLNFAHEADTALRSEHDVQRTVPESYVALLADAKPAIVHARQRALLAVNAEMSGLYWRLGRSNLTYMRALARPDEQPFQRTVGHRPSCSTTPPGTAALHWSRRRRCRC